MLVHMTPGEVESLQTIAHANGGALTTNPETGLPEAGFLSDILPAIAGIGLSFVPGIGPLAAGLLVGGGTALATKDLGRGLTAGLGAFGGAGLGSGLQGMSALTKVPAAGAGLKSAISSNVASFGSGAKQALTSGFGSFAPANAGAGIIGTGGMGATKAGLAALAPAFLSGMQPAPFRPMQTSEFNPYYGGPYKFNEGPVRFPTNEELLDEDTSEFSYFDYKYPQNYQRAFAEGGDVGGMENGRYLKGPGDGMSDDIPATIHHEDGNQQPARLAAGEFVIPADVVSHMGNGDSDSGAQKLYAMMDRIRRARTGSTEQAPEIDAEKYLPA
jgi:hypothetical protein